jgi:hypothetical protein
MTSGSDDSYEDSDSRNTDYQLNTANGSYSPSHYSNLMLVSIQKLEFKSLSMQTDFLRLTAMAMHLLSTKNAP